MFRHLGVLLLIFLPITAHAATCDPDQYLDGEFCYTCPANATCDGTNFTCNAGWFADGAICTQCSIANSSCTGPDDYSCLPGFYDKDGKCNACPDNATCAGGHEYFYCKPGYYKQSYNNVTQQCLSCASHVCDGETLISCGAGYYLHYTKRCTSCSTGQYCPAGTTTIICEEGYYKSAAGSCTTCPMGYYCPHNTMADDKYKYCASGYYRTGGSCSECPDGVVCPGGILDEMTCPDGLFKHDNGQCLSYAPGDCGIAPNCNPGCWNNGGQCTSCIAEHSTCTDGNDFTCMAGYYKNGQSCVACPQNSNCPAGSTQISCMDGYYLDAGQCTMCEVYGYYCTGNIRYECPPVIVGETLKLPPETTLITHGKNYTHPSSAAWADTQCIILDTYLSAPDGEYMIKESNNYDGAMYSIDDSLIKYWMSAATGHYLSNRDVSASYNEFYRNNNPCTNGAENSYYTGPGTPDGNDCPWVCNDGFYRDGNECLTCPPGMNCVGGSLVCPIGMYADKNQCLACPSGYTDAQTNGAQSIDMCQKRCDGGTYVATPKSNTCTNVGAGYWIGENYTNYGATGTPNACDDGMTTSGYGAGADESADCGRILHVGDKIIYLRSARRTTPSLMVKYADKLFYGNMSPNAPGDVKIKIGNTIYSLYDDSMIE